MKLGKLSATGIMALTVALAAPAVANAQNCIGLPIANQKAAASFTVAFPEDAKTFGFSGRMRLDGPLSLGASYSFTSIDNVDPKTHSFGVSGSYDLPVTQSAAVCAVAGVEHSQITVSDIKFSDLAIPLGVGIGKSFAAGNNAELVPFAMPHLLWIRSSISNSGVSINDSSAEFGLDVGATYRVQQLMLHAGLNFSSIEGSSTTFSVGVGYAF